MVVKNKKWRSYIFATCSLFFLLFLFEIIPDYSAIFNTLWSTITTNNIKNQINKYEAQITDLRNENLELKSSETNFLSTNENKKDISSVISFIDLVAHKSFIKKYSLKPGNFKKKDNLSILPIEVEINSDYSSVYNFIKFIERSSNVVIIKELTIKPKDVLQDSLVVKTNLEVYLNL